MSLYDGIESFLGEVDPKIFARGANYCRSGRVAFTAYSTRRVVAEVFGNEEEPYRTAVRFNKAGAVSSWECSCPYDWGPVCKHTVAVLLAVQAEPPEEPPREESAEGIEIRDLVEQAEKEQLAALVLEHCREDRRFMGEVLSLLDDGGEREFAAIKELVDRAVCSGGRVRASLDAALDKARRRAERGQYAQALGIAQLVLLTGMELLASEDEPLCGTLEVIEEAAGSIEDSGLRREWAQKLLKTAQSPVFDGWEERRYALLRRAAMLADVESEDSFYAVLADLSSRRWENFQDAPRYTEQDKIIRWYVLRAARGPETARAYSERMGIAAMLE